jgi:competence transcription factor ComK
VDKDLNYSNIEVNHVQSLFDENMSKITINNISKNCVFTLENRSCKIDLSNLIDRRILVIQIEPYENLETTLNKELRIESLEVS